MWRSKLKTETWRTCFRLSYTFLLSDSFNSIIIYFILSYPILSYLILHYLILHYLILSYLIWYYLILYYIIFFVVHKQFIWIIILIIHKICYINLKCLILIFQLFTSTLNFPFFTYCRNLWFQFLMRWWCRR